MSETPGQVAERVATERFGDAPPAGYDWPGFAHDAGADWDAVAAAFLAELPTDVLVDEVDRRGNSWEPNP